MRATERLHFLQMSGKLLAFLLFMVRHFTPFLHCPPGEAQREKADEVFWCEMLLFDINIHDLREEK